MVFSSITFLFYFLPMALILYYVSPKQIRNFVLFIVSLFFYAWGEPKYIILMLLSTIVDYTNGILIDNAFSKGKNRQAKLFLILSIVINLGLLCIFKYLNFLIANVNNIFGLSKGFCKIVLPIGISFYTFQTMSYTIDVYKRKVPVQKNIVSFGAYVTLFPQLIAGPIVRYSSISDQINNRRVTINKFSSGVNRFIIGLAKKVLLANNIGYLFDTISNQDLHQLSVATSWLGIIAYTFQIYFDFSGYSDMAIGLGKMFGFDFPENFNYPYISKSITEFWSRWHISLSSWFKEYVYIPLGGNRKGLFMQIRNISLVWMLTGIWHGASWNFIIWGIYYALLLIIEKCFLSSILCKLPKLFSHMYAMFFVIIGWCIFAFDDILIMKHYLITMFRLNNAVLIDKYFLYLMSSNIVLIIILCISSTNYPRHAFNQLFSEKTQFGFIVIKNIYIFLILLLSISYIVEASYNPFLYFRF
ncbi:MBOAT family protein [Clostridiaceae bacterium M8S5]|nr:MBOAT family protein [Clostridiaceae bacterium M8S5]